MRSTFQLALCLGMLALCFASPENNIRWCVKSDLEMKKCKDLAQTCVCAGTTLSCELKASAEDCYKAISEGAADAITLDSSEVYKASMNPYNLIPVAIENYGTETDPDTCYYSVALVSKGTDFMFKDLKGKRSCHTAVARAAGWTSPIGFMVAREQLKWDGPEIQSIEKAVAQYFSASCAPGAKEANLCKQCAGIGDKRCKASENEPYFGYAGALKCLEDGKGDVAFVKHILPAGTSQKYEILCPGDGRKPIEEYKDCYIGRIPAHAVVTLDKEEKIKAITQFLEEAQKKPSCQLFISNYGKDLMFKDSAKSIITLPNKMNAFLYLGAKFYEANKALRSVIESPSKDKIRWCTQNKDEKTKCDQWSVPSGGAIECVEASSAEECTIKVMKKEADAVSLDGGYLYTAGECGLIPVMQEIYDANACSQRRTDKKGSYYAVAVVKKSNKDINWKNLKNSKSCHTGLGRTAGYNVPVGMIYRDTDNCDLSTYFKESCIPGADPKSKLCSLCAGNPAKSYDTKCLPNSQELYYGYHGAMRCLVEVGDVAFVKQATPFEVFENANSPEWAKKWKRSDFELLCTDGSRMPIEEYEKCNLEQVPAHAVVTTPERKETVKNILNAQEVLFGRTGQQCEMFEMFTSVGTRDQLFKDSTQCLREVQEDNMKDYLGTGYHDAVTALYKCGKTGLLAACTFHTCKL